MLVWFFIAISVYFGRACLHLRLLLKIYFTVSIAVTASRNGISVHETSLTAVNQHVPELIRGTPPALRYFSTTFFIDLLRSGIGYITGEVHLQLTDERIGRQRRSCASPPGTEDRERSAADGLARFEPVEAHPERAVPSQLA